MDDTHKGREAFFEARPQNGARPASLTRGGLRHVSPQDGGIGVARLSEIVDARQLVVKTAALEEAVDGWSSAELRLAQSSHSATILATESGLSLSRATPMPPT